MKTLSREDMFEAIKQGVKEAILTMTETGDGYSGPIVYEPFMQAIKEGVTEAFPNIDFNDLSSSIENLSDQLDGLTSEIYKYRMDLKTKGI